jgi:hypothetical protein
MDFAVRSAAETSAAFAFGDDSSDGLLQYYVLPYDECLSFRIVNECNLIPSILIESQS